MRDPLHRFSSDRTGNVKYSTSCPCRTLSPCAASRAMPTSRGPESGSKGREDIVYSPFIRQHSTGELLSARKQRVSFRVADDSPTRPAESIKCDLIVEL